METRSLGRSGLKVPLLSLGTMTFGQSESFYRGFGAQGLDEVRRMVDICLETGVTFFDTADAYSAGESETILGEALKGRRQHVLINTKMSFRIAKGLNNVGSSRAYLTRALDASLKRLQTDYVDVLHLHGFDAMTPVEEALGTLNDMVQAGKVRYIGCSNFSGWHLMKSLAVSDRRGWARYVSHQAYYSMLSREYEWELMPLALAEDVGTMVWSPLGWGRLTGKFATGAPAPAPSRVPKTAEAGPPVAEGFLRKVSDALVSVARDVGKTPAQVALNWLSTRPSIANIVIGARNEAQLRDNLGAVGWRLDPAHIEKLDRVSAVTPVYPYWHQAQFAERNPPPCGYQTLSVPAATA